MSFNLVITNDPDHGLTKEYIPIFKELNNLGVKITTAVFCKIDTHDDYPSHPKSLTKHCNPSETHSLENPEYRDLMLEIKEQGHEIAFHGYSQISNKREEFEKGLEIYKDTFGEYPFVYVEHGGNPKKHVMEHCKKETIDMSGKDENSEYYIWDIIKDKIGCLWAHHHLIDDDLTIRKPKDIFYKEDGVLMCKRYRMRKFQEMLEVNGNKVQDDDLIIGYTHFGYRGHANDILDSWFNPTYLSRAINKLENIINQYNPKIYTLGDFVRNQL
tara:strand:- start:402 stop:1214 length:813 start_codon:yes stop_codon:yes gene_type:complete